jgi:ABC-2 type transport system ATP-binding protein
VGRNGSGKSTLLKLLAGIYTPDTGHIQINGKLTPFIELGVGFNFELTGRENVFLNGALLGFSRPEMEAMYKDIVAFAELERFMDQQLKNYSSGMQVRLAFSIAIRANSQILLLDEVLAVGDSNFQKKCFDYFAKLKRDKSTIVLVTHDMSAVERFCDRAILINEGKILLDGATDKVTKRYSDLNFKRAAGALKKNEDKTTNKTGSDDIKMEVKVAGSDSSDNIIDSDKDKKITIKYSINALQNVGKVKLGTIVKNAGGLPVFATNTKVNKLELSINEGVTEIILEVDNIFSNGEYSVTAGITSEDGSRIYYTNDNAGRFIVGGRKHDYALTSPAFNLNYSEFQNNKRSK